MKEWMGQVGTKVIKQIPVQRERHYLALAYFHVGEKNGLL